MKDTVLRRIDCNIRYAALRAQQRRHRQQLAELDEKIQRQQLKAAVEQAGGSGVVKQSSAAVVCGLPRGLVQEDLPVAALT